MPVTRDEVVNAYRFILGRYPESEDIVRVNYETMSDFDSLRKRCLISKEFEMLYWNLKEGEMAPISNDMPYASVRCIKGVQFCYSSKDEVIGKHMLMTGEVYSEKMMDAFFDLVNKFYGERKRSGYFFDIGANIGTTSIYVKKCINPSLKVIAFEPLKENFDLYRVNCILNDVEDIKLVNLGVGNVNTEGFMHINPANPAGSCLVSKPDMMDEKVKVIRLDDFCSTNSILSSDIDYIWIDTEGFESNVIAGGMDILRQKKIPLLQEFNPKSYTDWNEYQNNIKSIYEKFIDMGGNLRDDLRIYNMDELDSYREKILNKEFPQSDVFFF